MSTPWETTVTDLIALGTMYLFTTLNWWLKTILHYIALEIGLVDGRRIVTDYVKTLDKLYYGETQL